MRRVSILIILVYRMIAEVTLGQHAGLLVVVWRWRNLLPDLAE